MKNEKILKNIGKISNSKNFKNNKLFLIRMIND